MRFALPSSVDDVFLFFFWAISNHSGSQSQLNLNNSGTEKSTDWSDLEISARVEIQCDAVAMGEASQPMPAD